MDLNWVKLNGFKRFEKAILNTSGKLITLVGANEAGKSSILEALTFLNDDREFNKDNHFTRNKDFSLNDVVIEAGFYLSDQDRELITHIYDDELPKWLIVQKLASGRRTYSLELNGESLEIDKPEAINILKTTILPKFLLFNEQERNLVSTFNIATSDKVKPNKAFQNLLSLAEVNIQELNNTLNNRSLVRSKINKANDKLSEIYCGKWSQSQIKPVIEVNGTTLRVSIENKEKEDFELNQRSDGLRQFIALINFLEIEHAELPILLIDEAELHLHYDAQADLIKIFNQQQFASKIIYTTHSVGCLPEDLGTGVKLVTPIENDNNEERSEIKKHFWSTDKRPGVLPLLFGMGASQLAFMAIRQSLFVEGVSDMLLLPTLFRQAIGKDHLGFQTLQGIAETKRTKYSLLENHAPVVAFLVDNDDDGEYYKQDLIKAGIDEKRIFKLPSWKKAIVLEDYIRQDLFVEAVNNCIQKWNNNNIDKCFMSLDDLPQCNRPLAITNWCEKYTLRKIDKVELAYCLLDFAIGKRQENLIEHDLNQHLIELHGNILKVLK